jgi:hypothetical protein
MYIYIYECIYIYIYISHTHMYIYIYSHVKFAKAVWKPEPSLVNEESIATKWTDAAHEHGISGCT